MSVSALYIRLRQRVSVQTILCETYTIYIAFWNPLSLVLKVRFKVSGDPTPIPPVLGVPRAFPEKSRAVEVKAMNPAVHCYCRTKRWLDGR